MAKQPIWVTQSIGLLDCLTVTFKPVLSFDSQVNMYPLLNKNQAAWNFLSPDTEVTWRTVAIIIQVVLLSPYLCIRGVSLSSVQYTQSRRVYINQRHQYVCLIWS